MIKILLLDTSDLEGSDDTLAYSEMARADANIVGALDKTGRIVRIIKSRTTEVGEEITINEFCSLLDR